MRGDFKEYFNCGACKEFVEYILFECEHAIFLKHAGFFLDYLKQVFLQ